MGGTCASSSERRDIWNECAKGVNKCALSHLYKHLFTPFAPEVGWLLRVQLIASEISSEVASEIASEVSSEVSSEVASEVSSEIASEVASEVARGWDIRIERSMGVDQLLLVASNRLCQSASPSTERTSSKLYRPSTLSDTRAFSLATTQEMGSSIKT